MIRLDLNTSFAPEPTQIYVIDSADKMRIEETSAVGNQRTPALIIYTAAERELTIFPLVTSIFR